MPGIWVIPAADKPLRRGGPQPAAAPRGQSRHRSGPASAALGPQRPDSAGTVLELGWQSAGSSRRAAPARSWCAPAALRSRVQSPSASGSLDFRRRTALIGSRGRV